MTQLSSPTTSPLIGMSTATSALFRTDDVMLDTGSNLALFRDTMVGGAAVDGAQHGRPPGAQHGGARSGGGVERDVQD
jgi:hypothetical protein